MPRQTKALMQLEGIEGVKALLSGATPRGARAVTKSAFVRFASETKNKLRAAARERTGNLKGAIKSTSTKSGGAKVYAEKPKGSHAFIVRKGTGARRTKGGANRGAMPSSPQMDAVLTNAPAQFATEVVPRVAAEIKRRMERSLRKGV